MPQQIPPVGRLTPPRSTPPRAPTRSSSPANNRRQPAGRQPVSSPRSARRCQGLVAHGLRAGDRLAIMARTLYEWTLLDFARWTAGLVTVRAYPISSSAQARFVLQGAGVRACEVGNVEHARLATSVGGLLPNLEHLWQIDAGAVTQLVAAGREVPGEHLTARRARLPTRRPSLPSSTPATPPDAPRAAS